MKIQTLLELIEPSIKTTYSDKKQEYIRNNPNDDSVMGSGYYSTVRKSEDPHTVKKSSDLPTEGKHTDDAYWYFVDYIIQHKLWENPRFPRIYERERITGAEETGHHNVTMEKLERLNDKDDDEIIPLLRMSLNNEGKEEFKKIENSGNSILQTFVYIIKNAIKTGNTRHFRDESLVDAIKILHNMMKEKGFILDMHQGNIMGRRGPMGLQLVITDPFSFSKPQKR